MIMAANVALIFCLLASSRRNALTWTRMCLTATARFVGEVGGVQAVAIIYVLGENQMPLRSELADGTYEVKDTGEINVKLISKRWQGSEAPNVSN